MREHGDGSDMEQQLKPKKIPMRQCLGCNEHKPKRELLRVLKTPDGEILLDFTGRSSGRGAYICKSVKCLRKARKSGRIDKNLGASVPDAVYDRMEEELANERAE